jgi:hypothetical protein
MLMVGLPFTMPVQRCVDMTQVVSALNIVSWLKQGYLDIVKYLCDKGGATAPVDDVPGVDVRSKDGWTPLSKHRVQ